MRFIVLPVDTCWGKSRLDFAVWYSAVSSDKALTTENHSFIKVTIPFNLQIITTCTQLSPLYQSTIYNAGVKFHITREKPNVKVQSCSLMWRSRCVKKNEICPYLVRPCEIFQQKNHLCGQACKTATRNHSCAQNSLLKNQKRLQHVDSSCATGRNKKLDRQSSW